MKLLFKRQSLALIFCFTLTLSFFSCSTNDELDETQRIESQLEIKSVSPEELNALIQEQKAQEQSQSRNGFSSSSRGINCNQENFTIYWTGTAKLDGINDPVAALSERRGIRQHFADNYFLITILGGFPNETNAEFWVFNSEEANVNGGCHGDDVRTAVNANPSTSTEDEE